MSEEIANKIVALLTLKGYKSRMILVNSAPSRYSIVYQDSDGDEHGITGQTYVADLDFLLD